MSITAPSIHHHILFHRHEYGLNLRTQFPNYLENPNVCNIYGTTPLHVLCLDNYFCEAAEELIKSGAKVNAPNHFGSTPLHFAIIHRNEWMIEILIAHGADVNFQDMNGNAALHFAVKNSSTLLYLPQYQAGDLWIVQKLINSGAKIDIFNKDYETPLMWAVREDDVDVVKELLVCGADINFRNSGLESCLHVASNNTKPNIDILIELVKYGACINCLDQNGKTALDILLQSRNLDRGFKSAKALIKVTSLMNSVQEMNCLPTKEFHALNEFIVKCSKEVLRMKSILYTKNFSLGNFALNGVDDIKPAIPSEESILDQIFNTILNYSFPIYHDFIITKFKRSYLCEKLKEVYVYARTEEITTSVPLNQDVISEISCYLSDKDLYNVIRAYTKPNLTLSDIHKIAD